MCVCVSIQPGDTVSAVKSDVTAPAGAAPPIRRIFDPSTTIVVLRIVLPFPSYAVLTFSTVGWSCAIASHGSRATAPTITPSDFMVRFPLFGAVAPRAYNSSRTPHMIQRALDWRLLGTTVEEMTPKLVRLPVKGRLGSTKFGWLNRL